MAKRVALSHQQKTIESIRDWLGDQREAINDLRIKISTGRSGKFQGLDLTEINYYFDNSEEELEHLVCLDLVSATEAFLRVDYLNRVNKKGRSAISRIFRETHRKKGNKVSLEKDIIENWKNQKQDKPFSDFLGLLNYRNWLAHGRYWAYKQNYSFDTAYEISKNVIDLVLKQN